MKNEIVYDQDGNCYIEINCSTYGLQFIRIDETDIAAISAHTWHVMPNAPRRLRTGRERLYVRANIKQDDGSYKGVLLHRYLLNPQPGQHVDHINGDTADNRRCNLRAVTPTINKQNNTHSARGYYRTKSGKYRVVVTANKVSHYVGTFDSPIDARQAYIVAKRRYCAAAMAGR